MFALSVLEGITRSSPIAFQDLYKTLVTPCGSERGGGHSGPTVGKRLKDSSVEPPKAKVAKIPRGLLDDQVVKVQT